MACSGFIYYAAHDWNNRVKKLEDHPTYRQHTRNAARAWAEFTNLEQAYWDQKSAKTDGCREKIRLKSMNEEERKEHDCQKCREKCSDLREKADALQRKADRLEHRAVHGRRPLSPYFAFVQQHRHEFPGSPVAQAKACGERWRAMSPAEKSEYESREYRAWRAEHGGGGSLSSKLRKTSKAKTATA